MNTTKYKRLLSPLSPDKAARKVGIPGGLISRVLYLNIFVLRNELLILSDPKIATVLSFFPKVILHWGLYSVLRGYFPDIRSGAFVIWIYQTSDLLVILECRYIQFLDRNSVAVGMHFQNYQWQLSAYTWHGDPWIKGSLAVQMFGVKFISCSDRYNGLQIETMVKDAIATTTLPWSILCEINR